jgi:DUF2934 family protein
MRGDITERERRIRERAEQLWEAAGRPTGRDNEFWLEAESQVEAEMLKDQRSA